MLLQLAGSVSTQTHTRELNGSCCGTNDTLSDFAALLFLFSTHVLDPFWALTMFIFELFRCPQVSAGDKCPRVKFTTGQRPKWIHLLFSPDGSFALRRLKVHESGAFGFHPSSIELQRAGSVRVMKFAPVICFHTLRLDGEGPLHGEPTSRC